jgi:DtxR family Mn-dependent transcriptional regulator
MMVKADKTAAPQPRPTRAVEDYVKTIYALAERGERVATTAIARSLGVTASSVSAMLGRLRRLGLVSHRPFAEIALTDSGRQLAMRVLRRRRLIEAFLVADLGYGWAEVEAEAAVLDRASSERFVERIAARLGEPTVDPHGDPIPSAEGELNLAPTHVLATLEPGAAGRLVRAWNGDPDALRYLDSCNIRLGDRIEVLRREPFGGSIVIRVGGAKRGRIHGFGSGLAEMLSIELDR